MTIIFLNHCSVDVLQSSTNTYEIFKDIIVPILGSAVGILGAYLIMKNQLSEEGKKEKKNELSLNSLVRSVYATNLKIVELKLPAIIDVIENSVDDIEELDSSLLNLFLKIDGVDVILKQNYNELFKSYAHIFRTQEHSLNSFLLSYNAIHSIDITIMMINQLSKRFIEKCDLFQSEINFLSDEFVTNLKRVLHDETVDENLKTFLKTQFEENFVKVYSQEKTIEQFKNLCSSIMQNDQAIHLSKNNNIIELIIFIKSCLHKITLLINIKSDYKVIAKESIASFKKELAKIERFTSLYEKPTENDNTFKVKFT